MRRYTTVLITLLLLSALTLSTACSKAGGGALAGAGVGGAAGALTFKNKALGAALGGGAGLIAGYMIGNEMDKADLRKLQQVAETGKSGVPLAWVNPDSNKSYRAIPGPATLNADGLTQRNIDLVSPGGNVIHATWTRDEYGEWFLAER
jgi:hypothetical protein